MKSVLNIGGDSKTIPIPPYYDGWKHDLLDINPSGNPDIVADARNLPELNLPLYDAVYCSHNLEHYHRLDGLKVIRGAYQVLKDDGFFDVIVPDVLSVMRHVVQNNLDLEDVLYQAARGPINVLDTIYGYHGEVEEGNELFLHKTGFSPATLLKFVCPLGFPYYGIIPNDLEIHVQFFKQQPTQEQLKLLNLAMSPTLVKPTS